MKEYFNGLYITNNGNKIHWVPYRDGNIYKNGKHGFKFKINACEIENVCKI